MVTVESSGGAGGADDGRAGDASSSGETWNFDDRPQETPKAGAPKAAGRGTRRRPGTHVARVALMIRVDEKMI